MIARIGALAFAALLSASAFACQPPADRNQNNQGQGVANGQGVTNKQAQEPQTQPANSTPADQSEAEKKIASTRADFEKSRDDFLHSKQIDLDNLNQKVADLDANDKTATGKKKADLDAQLPKIHAMRDGYVNDLKNIQYATPQSWDMTKQRLDKEWKTLDDTVKNAP
ncbi:MAG TPA: hypothetical protein VGL81_32855 [Polyangiaceae bacterium]|jgi:hypothetical protein